MTIHAQAHQRYYVNGKQVPGVTTICKNVGWGSEVLQRWHNRKGLEGIDTSQYVDDLAKVGKLAHEMIVCYLTGQEPELRDYTQNQIDLAENSLLSFFEWEKKHKHRLIWAEKPLTSTKYLYGGKPDIYWEVDGEKELTDLKSGSGLYDGHFLQVGGGYSLLMEENNFPFKRVRLLNIPRTDNEAFIERDITYMVENCQEVFIMACKIHRLHKSIK